MIWRNRIWFLCALILTSALGAWAQDTVDSDLVRPSGVNGPVRKAKAATQKSSEDETESDTPKAKRSKSSHARSHRARATSEEEQDTIPAPAEFTPDGIPKTSAASVIVVDANSGRATQAPTPRRKVRRLSSTSMRRLLAALLVGSLFLECAALAESVWAEEAEPTPATRTVVLAAMKSPATPSRFARTPRVQATVVGGWVDRLAIG